MKYYIAVYKLFAYRLFIIGSIITLLVLPQKSVAQINAYAKVTSVAAKTLNLSNVNQTYHTFAAGEQIIIMQMQDNVIGSKHIR